MYNPAPCYRSTLCVNSTGSMALALLCHLAVPWQTKIYISFPPYCQLPTALSPHEDWVPPEPESIFSSPGMRSTGTST